MPNLRWFKHWNTASEGTLKLFFDARDYECIVLFWRLCELMSKYEQRSLSPGVMRLHKNTLSREMNMRPTKIRRKLGQISAISQTWSWRDLGEIWEFSCSNWLKFQETRGVKTMQKNCKKSGEERGERREERKNIYRPTQNPVASLPEFDFESLYLRYPRHVGKKKGLAKCHRLIDTPEKFDSLGRAVDNYAAFLKKNKAEEKFIKHFSTFMSEWEDWAEYKGNSKSIDVFRPKEF